VRAPTPVATVNALNANQNEQATGRPSCLALAILPTHIISIHNIRQLPKLVRIAWAQRLRSRLTGNEIKAKLLTQPLQTEVLVLIGMIGISELPNCLDQWIINETGPGKFVCKLLFGPAAI